MNRLILAAAVAVDHLESTRERLGQFLAQFSTLETTATGL